MHRRLTPATLTPFNVAQTAINRWLRPCPASEVVLRRPKDGIAFRASRPPNGSKLQFPHVDFDNRAITIAPCSATGGLDLEGPSLSILAETMRPINRPSRF
jgi:hypothetical protein